MAEVRDDALGPWPLGVNNRDTDSRLPEGSLRLGFNVDVSRRGSVRRRGGYVSRQAGDYHSLWSGDSGAFVVKSNALQKLAVSSAGAVTETALRSGLAAGRRLAYVEVGGSTYYSNGVVTGRVLSGADRPWGVEHAAALPVLAASASGGLDAGRYQVAITYVDDRGEEGGTAAAAAVTVAQGGGISVSAIPQPVAATVATIRLYVTRANGELFERYADLATGATTATVAKTATAGAPLETWDLYPPPAGEVLELHNGSIWIASGRYLWFTEPMRYGQVKRTNVYVFPEAISIVARVSGEQLAVAADRHYVLAGSDPHALALVKAHDCRGVKGTMVRLPDGESVAWATTRGWIDTRKGAMTEVLRDRAVLHEATTGGALYREVSGEAQFVVALHDGQTTQAFCSSYTEAEVIRRKAGVKA